MRLVSIVGDSLSTFEGFNPQDYSVFYNKELQEQNGLKSVYDTWWAKVNQALHAFLCVNNSYSGSKVSGKLFPAGGSEIRLRNLRTEIYSPDFILIYLGFNDFANGIPIFQKRGFLSRKDPDYFEDAYDIMLKRIKSYYPMAKIICGTLLRTKIKNNNDWIFPEYYAGVEFADYNNAIRRICQRNQCYLADVGSIGGRYETLDGSHPTAQGHLTIADAWIHCLADLELLDPSIETCIKMYNANKSDDMCCYMVFDALVKERVLIPFNRDGNFVGLPFENQTCIPIFTSPNEVGSNEPIQLQAVYLKENIETLLSLKMNLIVNPFSQPDKQFIIPWEAIGKMLIPIIDKQ